MELNHLSLILSGVVERRTAAGVVQLFTEWVLLLTVIDIPFRDNWINRSICRRTHEIQLRIKPVNLRIQHGM